jgi:hypothetical protein
MPITLEQFHEKARCSPEGCKACAMCRSKNPAHAAARMSALGMEWWTCPHGIGEKMRGLGDVIAKVTKAFGIKPCIGCSKRQAKLNKLVPFGDKVIESGNPKSGE